MHGGADVECLEVGTLLRAVRRGVSATVAVLGRVDVLFRCKLDGAEGRFTILCTGLHEFGDVGINEGVEVVAVEHRH